jgi:hypothetical protein
MCLSSNGVYSLLFAHSTLHETYAVMPRPSKYSEIARHHGLLQPDGLHVHSLCARTQ